MKPSELMIYANNIRQKIMRIVNRVYFINSPRISRPTQTSVPDFSKTPPTAKFVSPWHRAWLHQSNVSIASSHHRHILPMYASGGLTCKLTEYCMTQPSRHYVQCDLFGSYNPAYPRGHHWIDELKVALKLVQNAMAQICKRHCGSQR